MAALYRTPKMENVQAYSHNMQHPDAEHAVTSALIKGLK
jgi:hypothetical protein